MVWDRRDGCSISEKDRRLQSECECGLTSASIAGGRQCQGWFEIECALHLDLVVRLKEHFVASVERHVLIELRPSEPGPDRIAWSAGDKSEPSNPRAEISVCKEGGPRVVCAELNKAGDAVAPLVAPYALRSEPINALGSVLLDDPHRASKRERKFSGLVPSSDSECTGEALRTE